MIHTGIIRRIDNLGRVVIPKEIRKSLNIREGDALEIVVVDHSMVGFIPYRPTMEAAALCDRLKEEISFGNFSSSDTAELHKCINQFKSTLRIAEKNKEKEGF